MRANAVRFAAGLALMAFGDELVEARHGGPRRERLLPLRKGRRTRHRIAQARNALDEAGQRHAADALHHDRLAEHLAHMIADDPRQRINRAAWRQRQDDRNRMRRKRLRRGATDRRVDAQARWRKAEANLSRAGPEHMERTGSKHRRCH